MKKYIIITFTAAILMSCGGSDKNQSVEELVASGSLEQLRAKKTELDTEHKALIAQIESLDEKIKELSPALKMPLVTVFTTEQKKFEHFVDLQGNVSTKKNIVIYPEYAGVLTNVYVKKGQNVKSGQALAKIDDGGLSQQLAQMQIQAELAKTTFERQERLWNQKIGSEIQYLQAKSSYEAQEQAISQMQKQIGKTIVRAPFSGTIDDVITDQGTVVGPGQSQLFRLVNLDDMYIETDVPESYITNVTKGKDVEIFFPVLGKSMTAKVRQAGNFINPANRTFKVEVAVPNKERTIKPNLTAKLKINDYTSENAILIPQSIISENSEGQQYVYTVTTKNDSVAVAKQTIIETGKTSGDYIEILSGLENGSKIIEEGARSVKDGQEVKVLETK
ncbi:MAG: efflux RND transporter periplasmic adaptor subunit [Winogradskyella sp.]|uniref:efflux RND transporter periplasmic adaptor subunit n=1 Tax=Winogradskyella sp. TaxID=1883156 RepID=UPI0025E0289C|nr:efflux RND transporter periplasmic adaptor subunit [Winogradskyella sp.]NRB59849.1 efflux RND transporter periplasmic adaptor subunit [Winogradskyella sp.]